MNYEFFWTSKSPFSNWYPSKFVIGDKTFSNNEQWMMYNKAILFEDAEIAEKIMKNPDPKTCKALGRKVKGFDNVLWNSMCMKIVTEGLLQKFEQNPELKEIFQ